MIINDLYNWYRFNMHVVSEGGYSGDSILDLTDASKCAILRVYESRNTDGFRSQVPLAVRI